MSTEIEKRQIRISEVLSLLDEGKSRKEIAQFYSKTMAEMNALVWSHPKLKGRKAKKQKDSIMLIDDIEENATMQVSPAPPTPLIPHQVDLEESIKEVEEEQTQEPESEEIPDQEPATNANGTW